MQRRDFLRLSVGATVLASVPALAEGNGVKDNFSTLDPLVGKAMEAFNAKNWKKFYADWAVQVKSIQTETAFTSLYINMFQMQYGTFKSRKLVDAKSTFSDLNGLLVYEAEFSSKKGQLSVNFFKEGGKFKIQQITIGPVQ